MRRCPGARHELPGVPDVQEAMTDAPASSRGRPRGGPGRAERRAELVDIAIRVVSERGARATLNEIANEAGLTKPVLYAHFEGKSGLATVIGEHTRQILSAEIGEAIKTAGDTESALRAMFDTLFRTFKREANLIAFVIVWTYRDDDATKVPGFIQLLAQDLAEVLADLLRAAGSDPEPAETWAYGLMGMAYVTSEWWKRSHRPFPREQLLDLLTTCASGGLSGIGLGDLGTRDAEWTAMISQVVGRPATID